MWTTAILYDRNNDRILILQYEGVVGDQLAKAVAFNDAAFESVDEYESANLYDLGFTMHAEFSGKLSPIMTTDADVFELSDADRKTLDGRIEEKYGDRNVEEDEDEDDSE